MLRLIHTADWHLGHTLHGLAREHEHGCFLAWLLDTLDRERADALIVAGDVFDSANPPASAQAMFYRFLRDAKERLPRLAVVIVGGNHDSASRLAAPAPLLDAFDVHVVGGLARSDGALDWDRMVVPLRDPSGRLAAVVGAMPFLRNADLPAGEEGGASDPLVAGVTARYAELVAHVRRAAGDGAALVLTGHCYLTGTRLSELSERKVLGGNQHALPVDLFPADIAYVALGHLHLAQPVGGLAHVRYSGSPIPLALDEAGYPHQVLRVDVHDARLVAVEPLRVPRTVEILRVPAAGALEPDAVFEVLARLPLDDALPPERHPFLEVQVRLPTPEPGLRTRIEQAVAGRPVRLLRLGIEHTGTGDALADATPAAALESLGPTEVFARRFRALHEGDPPAALCDAFTALLDQVEQED